MKYTLCCANFILFCFPSQKSEEVIKRSNSCRRYFRKTEARHLREKEYEESIKSLESDTSLLAVEEKDERIVSNVIIPQKEEKEELKEPKDEKEVSAPKEEKEEVRAPKEEKETVVQDHGIGNYNNLIVWSRY